MFFLKKGSIFSFLGLFLFPKIVLAVSKPQNFSDLLNVIMGLLNMLIPILISLAVLAFLSGIALYILKGDSKEERSKGKQFMFWGIIGLFVMVSFWGIINMLRDTFFNNPVPIQQQENSSPFQLSI